jgi:hypothetical protein
MSCFLTVFTLLARSAELGFQIIWDDSALDDALEGLKCGHNLDILCDPGQEGAPGLLTWRTPGPILMIYAVRASLNEPQRCGLPRPNRLTQPFPRPRG